MNITQIYEDYPTREDCISHLEQVRWRDKTICPYCNSEKSTKMNESRINKRTGEVIPTWRHHCLGCRTSYSVTVNTIFHNTKLDIQKWFVAISLVLNAKKGLSSRQLARDIRVNKDTAHRMQLSISYAMTEYGDYLRGVVEVDETYVGGKSKNKHKSKRKKGTQGRSLVDKFAVVGAIERGGRVVAQKTKDVTGKSLKSFIADNVKKGTVVCTDEWGAYNGLDKGGYDHKRVDHGKDKYVIGDAHTNTLEGFWSIFKRGIMGQSPPFRKIHRSLYCTVFS